jgi:recombination protein RecR
MTTRPPEKGGGILGGLISALTRLPGIGRKTAQRLAFHILKMSTEEADHLAGAIAAAKEKLAFCQICHNITELPVCEICADPRRDRTTLMVVEEPSTLYAIERTREYKGLYHVLHGSLSPMDGAGPDSIFCGDLPGRAGSGEIKEVILATSPTIEGEATAMYVAKQLQPFPIKATRLAYGVPVGIDLDLLDEVTLVKSLEGRRDMGGV